MTNTLLNLFIIILKILLIVISILVSVAFFTLAERKILATIQRRRGPNVVGIYGLLQPISDGFKLLLKETILPSSANTLIFYFAPVITFMLSLIGWGLIPFSKYGTFSELDLGLLYIIGISSLGIYGIIFSGWSSNSKYAFLGALRSTAQMVSYELSLGFILCTIAICSESFNLNIIINTQKNIWFFIPFFPLSIMFFIVGLAETNRHPFDLPEAEAELVSGYNVEYSAMTFALFSLAEYSNMLLMSSLNVILFYGGWLSPIAILNTYLPSIIWFSIKLLIFIVLYVIARAILPRYRYDQLMGLGWKVFLPIAIGYLVFTFCYMYGFDFYNY